MTNPHTHDLLTVPPADVVPYEVAAQAIRYLDHVAARVGTRYADDRHARLTIQAAAYAAGDLLVPSLQERVAIGDDPPLDQPLQDVVAQVRTLLAAVQPTGTGVDLLHILTLVDHLQDHLADAARRGGGST